jgi:hypothetical protein
MARHSGRVEPTFFFGLPFASLTSLPGRKECKVLIEVVASEDSRFHGGEVQKKSLKISHVWKSLR